MLIAEGWEVSLVPETLDYCGNGLTIGRVYHEERRIELTAESDRTALVFLHEIGHILEKKIRPELIRAGYTSCETLPDIVFHGGADSAYHEQLYGEYLANYLPEMLFWIKNAKLADKSFLRVYLKAISSIE